MEDIEIKPMEPKGLEMIPQRELDVHADSIATMKDEPQIVDTHVSWLAIIVLWVKENLINDILISKQGVPMEQTKLWYASKTLWVNVLTLVWFFVGPLIGVPTLSPELTVTLLGGINLILRAITKKEVVLA